MPYVGLGTNKGVVVDYSDAMEYVLEHCGLTVHCPTEETKDALDALKFWYFSGNWAEEPEDGEE